ncbi:hypothetical protein AU196_24845 [Mycobacterium sp. IS-1742]|nr:hypothetical protein AU196_24845 [Mycobacterium sp. IS-1742]
MVGPAEMQRDERLLPVLTITQPLDIESTKVARLVGPGAEFRFVFDLGDDWTHRCVVGEDKIDPRETSGIAPKKPLPYWGLGQYPGPVRAPVG